MSRQLKVGDTFTLPGSTQPIEIIGFYDRPIFVFLGETQPPDKLSCEKTTWVVLRYRLSVKPDEEAKWVRLECELERLNR